MFILNWIVYGLNVPWHHVFAKKVSFANRHRIINNVDLSHVKGQTVLSQPTGKLNQRNNTMY